MNYADRFLQKVDQGAACWMWTGAKSSKGYGQFWLKGKQESAHRVSYALFVGIIPEGSLVCHTCDQPSCVRPEHLWTGTHSANTLDAVAKGRHVTHNTAKTHCPRGHEYSVGNTRVYRGSRFCRACQGEVNARVARKRKLLLTSLIDSDIVRARWGDPITRWKHVT